MAHVAVWFSEVKVFVEQVVFMPKQLIGATRQKYWVLHTNTGVVAVVPVPAARNVPPVPFCTSVWLVPKYTSYPSVPGPAVSQLSVVATNGRLLARLAGLLMDTQGGGVLVVVKVFTTQPVFVPTQLVGSTRQ